MVYDLDREEYIEESAIEEQVEDTNDVLDNMLEACEYMMDMLGLDEGARTKYVEMKAKEAKELEDKANAMPDKVTSTKSKKIGPYTFSASREKYNKEKRDTMNKSFDAEKNAAKYSGNFEDYGPKGKVEYDEDGKKHVVYASMRDSASSARSIHDAGKPKYRFDSGAHVTYGKNYKRSSNVDYEQMAKSKAGKDQFNKDFGGPSGDNHISKKMESIYRSKSGDYTHDDPKKAAEYNKKVLKDHFAKKKAVKEACIAILSALDGIE